MKENYAEIHRTIFGSKFERSLSPEQSVEFPIRRLVVIYANCQDRITNDDIVRASFQR